MRQAKKTDYNRAGQESETLTQNDVAIIRTLKMLGFHNKRIAALFDVNQGRISEVTAND
jgi:predicted XRE-type DNA-binding protein